MISLVRGGMTTRNAWGSTMLTIVLRSSSPGLRAASTCPAGTAWMPARMVSAMYAAAVSPSPTITLP
jgi:hypothetical protein